MRFVPWVLGLVLLGCGGGDGSDDGEAAGSEANAAPHFTVEGRGESSKLSAVLDVVEGEERSRLAITGSDAADNLIAIYATFHGTDSVVGEHVFPVGSVDSEVFAVGTIDGRVYQSQSGELRVSMTSNWHSEGAFEITLALDETVPVMPPPGAAEPTTPAAAEQTLVGTFASDWRVNCRSYISGFTGGHAMSDSPYCLALTF